MAGTAGAVEGTVRGTVSAVGNTWQFAKDAVDGTWNGAKAKVSTRWNSAKNRVAQRWDKAKEHVRQSADTAADEARAAWNRARPSKRTVLAATSDRATEPATKIKAVGGRAYEKVKEAIAHPGQALKNTVAAVGASIDRLRVSGLDGLMHKKDPREGTRWGKLTAFVL